MYKPFFGWILPDQCRYNSAHLYPPSHCPIVNLIKVAVPVPLRRLFDYAVPETVDCETLAIGSRVLVPFGSKQLVGVVCQLPAPADEDAYDLTKIKPLSDIIDTEAVFDEHLYKLLTWAAGYYQHPLGDVFATALPALLRENKTQTDLIPDSYRLTAKGHQWSPIQLNKAARQKAALEAFKQNDELDKTALKARNISTQTLNALIDKQLVEACQPTFVPFGIRRQCQKRSPIESQR